MEIEAVLGHTFRQQEGCGVEVRRASGAWERGVRVRTGPPGRRVSGCSHSGSSSYTNWGNTDDT